MHEKVTFIGCDFNEWLKKIPQINCYPLLYSFVRSISFFFSLKIALVLIARKALTPHCLVIVSPSLVPRCVGHFIL